MNMVTPARTADRPASSGNEHQATAAGNGAFDEALAGAETVLDTSNTSKAEPGDRADGRAESSQTHTSSTDDAAEATPHDDAETDTESHGEADASGDVDAATAAAAAEAGATAPAATTSTAPVAVSATAETPAIETAEVVVIPTAATRVTSTVPDAMEAAFRAAAGTPVETVEADTSTSLAPQAATVPTTDGATQDTQGSVKPVATSTQTSEDTQVDITTAVPAGEKEARASAQTPTGANGLKVVNADDVAGPTTQVDTAATATARTATTATTATTAPVQAKESTAPAVPVPGTIGVDETQLARQQAAAVTATATESSADDVEPAGGATTATTPVTSTAVTSGSGSWTGDATDTAKPQLPTAPIDAELPEVDARPATAPPVVRAPAVQPTVNTAQPEVEAPVDAAPAETPAPATAQAVPVQERAPATAAPVRGELSNMVMTQERIDHIAEQLATRMRLSQSAGGSQVQLHLRPRELGEVQVSIAIRHGVVTASVLVERGDTGRLLQNNLDDLRRSLEAQGLDVQQFNVDVRGGDTGDAFQRMAQGSSGWSNTSGGDASHADSSDEDGLVPGLSGSNMVAPEDHHDGNVSVLA